MTPVFPLLSIMGAQIRAHRCLQKWAENLAAIFILGGSLTSHLAMSKDFIIATRHELAEIYPLTQMAGDDLAVRNLLNPPILEIRSDGRISCLLCKEVPDVERVRDEEGGKSQTIITLELKKKLLWGDGTPMSAVDVKFTLETMSLGNYPRGKGRIPPILPIRRIEIDQNQKTKLKLVLSSKRSDSFQLFAISLLPAHKADIIAHLQNAPKDAVWWSKLQDPGLYYGPYIVKDASSKRWLLSSNKSSSWENAPSENIEVRPYTNLSALGKALATGEIDQTANSEISWSDYLELKSQLPSLDQTYSVQTRPGTNLEILLLNMRSPILVNPSMRQVLFHAIDRNRLVKEALPNWGMAASSLLHPRQLERFGEKYLDPFKPALVEQLLQQSGVKKDIEGNLLIDGQKLSLVLSCSDSRLKSGLYKPLIEDLRRIGLEVKVESMPEEEFMRYVVGHRRFKDMACLRWQLPPLSSPIGLMHSLAIPTIENNYFGSNFSGWDQPIVDRILESILYEGDLAQVHRLFARLDKQFVSEVPAIPLVYLPEIWLSRKDQKNPDLLQTQTKISTYPVANETPQRRKM